MANTGRMNLAEELGRIDSEKMNSNRRAEKDRVISELNKGYNCLLYTSPSPRDRTRSRMPSSA